MNSDVSSPFSAVARQSANPLQKFKAALTALSPAGDLLLRLWVANAFWVSGLTKLRNWDGTLYLFEEEYAVPLLPPDLAAYMGTTVELVFPALLAIGFLGRAAAAVLFVFNIIAVISYPDLGAAGLEQHKVWGVILLACLTRGPGTWSMDDWLGWRFFRAE